MVFRKRDYSVHDAVTNVIDIVVSNLIDSFIS